MYMQNSDKYDKGKLHTSVEIVDIAPPNTDNDSISKTDLFAGVTELSK